MFPYLALLRVGFAKPPRYRVAGALLPHLFTLTVGEFWGRILGTAPELPCTASNSEAVPRIRPQNSHGGMFSVALSVPYEPSNYEAHCPVELGLSSPFGAITRLPANSLS